VNQYPRGQAGATEDRADRARPARAGERQDPVPGAPDPTLPVVFLHIPRTAGFTLKTVLQTFFGMRSSLLDIHHYPHGLDIRPFAFIEGHANTSYFRRSLGPAWYRNGLTILRDPVARVVSQARHIRAMRTGPWYPMLESTIDDPEDLFEKVPLLINLQTKQLGGLQPRAEVVSSTIDDAKIALDHLAFGLTEQFEASMALFAERFELDLPDFGVTNTMPALGDEDLRSDGFRAAARTHNQCDEKVYAYACKLFRCRVTDYVERLLALPLDDGRIEYVLHAGAKRVADAIVVRPSTRSVKLRGYVLVDGFRADAVLIRVGEQTTPLACRVVSMGAANRSREVVNRYAGVRGTIELPGSASQLELIAFDRVRGRRSQTTIEVARDTG
jgi:hypothetical protein